MSGLNAALDNQEKGVKGMLMEYKVEFANVLPSQIVSDRWVFLAREQLKKNRDLLTAAEANPSAYFRVLMECARLGHEPGDGRYHMIPIQNKKNNTWRIDGWEDYRGIISRILRSGKYKRVEAEVVYSGDRFAWNPGKMDLPDHEIDFMNDRGEPRLAYAYAVHNDGSYTKVAIATPDHIKKVRAEAYKPDDVNSPWMKWTDSMYVKCGVKILEKWVDTSAEDKSELHRQVEPAQPSFDHNAEIIDVTPYPEVALESGETVE